MKIKLADRIGTFLAEAEGENSVELVYDKAFGFEDILTFETEPNSFVEIDIDPEINKSIVFTPSGVITFQIPVNQKLRAYHPDAFQGDSHTVSMSIVSDDVLAGRRNLALNGMDKRWETGYYPHAEGNVVTRDEPWFEAKNAIDGWTKNDGHGAWPFQSWGGGLRDDLEFTLDFGREVSIDEIIIFLRADLVDEHDVNWESGVLEFSNGEEMPIHMALTQDGQSFKFEAKTITWLKLKNLKREISRAFSALTQIEVYGTEK